MPTYLAIIVAAATPLFAFGGVLLGHRMTRRGAVELDTWRRREETMRMLGWAVELSTSDSDSRATAGFAALRALGGSELQQPADAPMLRDLLDAVLADLAQAYPEKDDSAEGADVGV